jgi:hypothetical protein
VLVLNDQYAPVASGLKKLVYSAIVKEWPTIISLINNLPVLVKLDPINTTAGAVYSKPKIIIFPRTIRESILFY